MKTTSSVRYRLIMLQIEVIYIRNHAAILLVYVTFVGSLYRFWILQMCFNCLCIKKEPVDHILADSWLQRVICLARLKILVRNVGYMRVRQMGYLCNIKLLCFQLLLGLIVKLTKRTTVLMLWQVLWTWENLLYLLLSGYHLNCQIHYRTDRSRNVKTWLLMLRAWLLCSGAKSRHQPRWSSGVRCCSTGRSARWRGRHWRPGASWC